MRRGNDQDYCLHDRDAWAEKTVELAGTETHEERRIPRAPKGYGPQRPAVGLPTYRSLVFKPPWREPNEDNERTDATPCRERGKTDGRDGRIV